MEFDLKGLEVKVRGIVMYSDNGEMQ